MGGYQVVQLMSLVMGIRHNMSEIRVTLALSLIVPIIYP